MRSRSVVDDRGLMMDVAGDQAGLCGQRRGKLWVRRGSGNDEGLAHSYCFTHRPPLTCGEGYRHYWFTWPRLSIAVCAMYLASSGTLPPQRTTMCPLTVNTQPMTASLLTISPARSPIESDPLAPLLGDCLWASRALTSHRRAGQATRHQIPTLPRPSAVGQQAVVTATTSDFKINAKSARHPHTPRPRLPGRTLDLEYGPLAFEAHSRPYCAPPPFPTSFFHSFAPVAPCILVRAATQPRRTHTRQVASSMFVVAC